MKEEDYRIHLAAFGKGLVVALSWGGVLLLLIKFVLGRLLLHVNGLHELARLINDDPGMYKAVGFWLLLFSFVAHAEQTSGRKGLQPYASLRARWHAIAFISVGIVCIICSVVLTK